MRGVNKLGLAVLLTGLATCFGIPKKANAFDGYGVYTSNYIVYDHHVFEMRAAIYADSLNKKVDSLKKELQNLQDKHPELSFISLILPPSGGPTDRIGTGPNALGGNSTPSTALVYIMDIFDIDTSGIVQGVKLKKNYRNASVRMFGGDETAELETALSTLLTNGGDVCRVVYKGPDANIKYVSDPSPYPAWLDRIDGKHAYMLIRILFDSGKIAPQDAGQYIKEYDSIYKQILILLYQLERAERAAYLAKWLDNNATNPDISEDQKKQAHSELMFLLENLGLIRR